jgi:Transcription factor WhiB
MTTLTEADPRIPFPRSDSPTVCRTSPAWFAHEHGDTSADTTGRVERANAACWACPIVNSCFRWALASSGMTSTGIWAATIARQRTILGASKTGSDPTGSASPRSRPPRRRRPRRSTARRRRR